MQWCLLKLMVTGFQQMPLEIVPCSFHLPVVKNIYTASCFILSKLKPSWWVSILSFKCYTVY